MKSHEMQFHPSAIRRTSRDDGHSAANTPRLMGGVSYAPADAMKLGFEGETMDQPQGVGLLFMSVQQVGLSIAMPPPSNAGTGAATEFSSRYGGAGRRQGGHRCHRARKGAQQMTGGPSQRQRVMTHVMASAASAGVYTPQPPVIAPAEDIQADPHGAPSGPMRPAVPLWLGLALAIGVAAIIWHHRQWSAAL